MEGRSNCHLHVWQLYRAGVVNAICLQPTRFSKLEKIAEHPLWRYSISLLGIVVQWICWPGTHLGEFLRSGRWYHVVGITFDGRVIEYVPMDIKVKRWFVPPLFKGEQREIEYSLKSRFGDKQ